MPTDSRPDLPATGPPPALIGAGPGTGAVDRPAAGSQAGQHGHPGHRRLRELPQRIERPHQYRTQLRRPESAARELRAVAAATTALDGGDLVR
jgi:hypothetical protein